MPARNEACPCGSGKRFKHCHGVLDRPPQDLRVEPLPSIDDLLDAASATQALEDSERRLLSADNDLRLKLLRGLSNRLVAFPQALMADLSSGGESVGLVPIGPDDIRVLLVNGDSCRLNLGDGALAAIDASFVLKASELTFFATWPVPYASLVAATLFVATAVIRHRPIPFQFELAALTWMMSESGARSVQADVGDLVTLHEIGHSYAELHGTEFVDMVVFPKHEANNISPVLAKDGWQLSSFRGAASMWGVLRNQLNNQSKLVLPSYDERELIEYAPDIFALMARTVLDGQGPVRVNGLHVLPARHVIWSWVMLLQESIQEQAEGGEAWRLVRQLQRRADGARARPTHPASATRSDVLLFHMLRLVDRFGGVETAGLRSKLMDQQQAIWSEKPLIHLHLLLDPLIQSERSVAMKPWIEQFDAAQSDYGDLPPGLKYLCARVLSPLADLATTCLRGETPRSLAAILAKKIGSETLDSMLADHADTSSSVDGLVLQLSRHIMGTPKFSEN